MKLLKTTLKIFAVIMICILVWTESISILFPVYLIGLLLLMIFGLLEWGLDAIIRDHSVINWINGYFPGIDPKGLVGWVALIVFYLVISYLIALIVEKRRRKKALKI
jgi:hypothetical protein